MTGTILVLTAFESPSCRVLIDGIARFARREKWRMQVVETVRTGCNPQRAVQAIMPDGVIAYCAPPSGVPFRLANRSVPVVHVNPGKAGRGMTAVCHDSTGTGVLAAREFLRLGLANFAYIGWETPFRWSEKRGEAFAAEIMACGRTCSMFGGGWCRNDPRKARAEIGRWLASLHRPCGVFAANDETAAMVIAAALGAGLAVPDDIAVIGVDDDVGVCENAPVTITSIRPDFAVGGTLAAELLAARIASPGLPAETRQYGDAEIVRRSSTRLLGGRGRNVSALLEYIRLNACSGIGVDDVVRLTKLSRRSVEVIFRETVGRSVLEEIHRVRLDAACALLRNPRIAIGSIASRTGYFSENFLARLFKREKGMTMREWRNRELQAHLPDSCARVRRD